MSGAPPLGIQREALLMSVDTAQLLPYSDQLCFVSCVCTGVTAWLANYLVLWLVLGLILIERMGN